MERNASHVVFSDRNFIKMMKNHSDNVSIHKCSHHKTRITINSKENKETFLKYIFVYILHLCICLQHIRILLRALVS